MGGAQILISSLHAALNTRLVIIGNFLAGLLVGTLLGLALAPIVRAWLTWKTVEEARRADDRTSDARPTRVDT
jgi:ABC-type protease/lipase transport system fused ATPase/permease subunit